ncbi:MAG TPA: TolC family protein [Saprospiraceae bacterium]|jgi:outer membrane protein TolC|nr:TolC family protein [Saprospiraceae bacterium]HMT70285.1 TolC family protein [Saprospiraceae bacterium]
MRQYLLLIFCFILVQIDAQQVRTLSLSEAVNLGLNNAIEIKNLLLDEQIQQAQNKQITGSVYPQISASGQLTYYANLPKIIFPTSDISVYQVLEKEGISDDQGNKITVKNASFGFQPVSFVAPLNYQYGVSVQQLLFQPDIFVALQARNTVLEMAKANTEVSRQKVKEAIQKAYYAVLVAQSQKTVIDATMIRLEKLHNEVTQMFKNGFAEKLDIDKLSVTLNNTKSAQNQINNGILMSKSLLKNTLGIPQQDSVILTETLEINQLQADILALDENLDYNNRSEIAALEVAKKLQNLDLKRYKLSYLPTVAAFYQFQRSGQRNESYAIGGNSPWFAYNTGLIGLSINQTLFDGFQNKNRIQQVKLNIEKLENSSSQLKQYIDLENNIAKSSLRNAVLNLEVQKRNLELAESVFQSTTKKYQAGLGSSFEVIQTDTEYQRASGSYFQALYDASIAKVNFYKSIGKL